MSLPFTSIKLYCMLLTDRGIKACLTSLRDIGWSNGQMPSTFIAVLSWWCCCNSATCICSLDKQPSKFAKCCGCWVNCISYMITEATKGTASMITSIFQLFNCVYGINIHRTHTVWHSNVLLNHVNSMWMLLVHWPKSCLYRLVENKPDYSTM